MNRSNGALKQITGLKRGERAALFGFDHRGRSKTYRSWESMKQRCLNPKFSSYRWYGGSGITICDRWLGENGFQNFWKDLGDVPIGLTLERIEVRGNYEPNNCKWATRTQQARNRRNSKFVTFGDKTQVIAAWAEEIGVCAGTLSSRLYRGLSAAEILSKEVAGRK